MVTCGSCGSTVPEGAGTCPHCGVELSAGSTGDLEEADPGEGGGAGSRHTAGDREISSEEAESGTTRIYGVDEFEAAGGEPPAEEETETAAVESSTTRVSETDETAPVGSEARDPPPGSRPTRDPTDDGDGENRRRVLAGLGLFALGAGGLYAFLARNGGTDSGGGTDGTSDGESGTDGTGDDGSDGSSETDPSESETTTDGDGQTSDDPRSIELGILMGISGALDTLGPPIRDGAELVARQINEAETDISVDARFEDTATDPSRGIEGAQELIDAGYPMICGALASDVSIPVAEEAAIPDEIPMNSPASTAPTFTELEGDLTFRTAVQDYFQGQMMAEIADERLGADSAAVLAQDDVYGHELSAAFVDAFADAGGTITDEVIFTRGQDSYAGELDTLLYGDPDLLVVVTFPPDAVQIFRDFYGEFDRDEMPILVSDALRNESLPEDVGYEMTNVTGTFPVQEGPGMDAFAELYEEAYGEDPKTKAFTRHAYDAAATLVLAQAAAGEKDGPAIRDQIRPVTDPGGTEIRPENLVEGVELAAAGEEIEYRGASGEIQYDDRGDQTAVGFEYFGFTSYGDIEIIDTFVFE